MPVCRAGPVFSVVPVSPVARRQERSMASRSTWRSSKARTTPAMSWPCSWPLPHDQYGVALPRAGDHGGDGRRPVGVDQDVPALVDGHLGGAREHRGEDRERVLGARVVRGQYGGVGEPRGGGPHRRALGLVAVAAAAQDDVHLAPGDLAQGAQDRFDGVRLVRVVDDREIRLADVDALQPYSGRRGRPRCRRRRPGGRFRPRRA